MEWLWLTSRGVGTTRSRARLGRWPTPRSSQSQVRKPPLFAMPFDAEKHLNLLPDRLGTNIGKSLHKSEMMGFSVGWRMLSHDSGTSLLAEGGSIVTRLSEDKQDWSAVIEKMSTANSVCARGSNPVSAMTVEGNTQMRATWRAVFSPRKFPCVRPEPVLVSHRLSTQREETQLTKRACRCFWFVLSSVRSKSRSYPRSSPSH